MDSEVAFMLTESHCHNEITPIASCFIHSYDCQHIQYLYFHVPPFNCCDNGLIPSIQKYPITVVFIYPLLNLPRSSLSYFSISKPFLKVCMPQEALYYLQGLKSINSLNSYGFFYLSLWLNSYFFVFKIIYSA